MEKLLPAQVLKAAGVLATRVGLDKVCIKEASFGSSGDWDSQTHIDANAVLQSIDPVTYVFNEKTNTLDVDISFMVSLGKQTTKANGFQIKAIFVARYHLTTTPPPQDMRELFFGSFSKSNALLNVWPYWREFASSCNDRMGLPHWNLPVLRLVPEPVEGKESVKKSSGTAKKATPTKKTAAKAKK